LIVPVQEASGKNEWAAATFRPRVRRLVESYLAPVAQVPAARDSLALRLELPIMRPGPELLDALRVDRSVGPVSRRGGTGAALGRLTQFLAGPLQEYHTARNDPGRDLQSGLSPYLHFGQISPVTVALAALDALEAAGTHDPYWNAAMNEMRATGVMHGYMRMYWGKKILEWSRSPEEGFTTALRLNNRYFLDGRDPNSYAGVAWCFGKHDRPWAERPVFGKVRSMTASGLERKFDMKAYLQRASPLTGQDARAGPDAAAGPGAG
jgi:deoxyribodipyrimidine photo-lyase